jgi:hypothetical protein
MSNDYPKDSSNKPTVKGKVKVLTEVSFFEFYDCQFHRSYITDKRVYHFNINGKILSEEYSRNYNDSPVIDTKFSDTADRTQLFFYDVGNLVRKEHYSHGELRWTADFVYDGKKRMVAVYSTEVGKRIKNLVYRYMGNVTVEETLGGEKNIKSKRITTKKNGDILEIRDSSVYNSEWHLRGLQKYANGRLSERWFVNRDLDSVYLSSRSIYDVDGDLVADTSYGEFGGIEYVWQYLYDGKGRLVKFIKKDMRSPMTDEDYEEMYKGIDRKHFDHNETVLYKYEDFDPHGNYLKMIAQSDKQITSITQRTIEYYK